MKSDKELAKLFLTQNSWLTVGTDTQYNIYEYPDEYVIIFAESNSSADWKTNFRFKRKPYKEMDIPFLVHKGFLSEWKLINDFFIAEVQSMLDKPITIVGWSYGGAMATLCKEDLWYNFPPIRNSLRLITFGSPRVIGWRNYSKIKERWANTTRYKNDYDLVTMVPFWLMLYRHVCKATRLHTHDSFIHMLRCHKIERYIDNME